MMNSIGHSELYKMGFDGASIGTLRQLKPEQIIRLIEILEEFKTEKENKK